MLGWRLTNHLSREEGARRILGVFHRLGRHPGEVLRRQSFTELFDELDWHKADFDRAIGLAVKRGWLTEHGGWYDLTATGYAEAEMPDT